MTATENRSETTPVREGFAIEIEPLTRWMRNNVPDFVGPLSIMQFKGGQSNPTYRLDTPDRSYVLRRKPPGELLKGAHAVDREARIIGALAAADFPVPRLYGLCTDDTIIGTAFYVMEMVEGRIFWNAALPEIDPGERRSYFDALNATMARLHTLDYPALGLSDYGRAGNYFERQISRWIRQYQEDEAAGRDPNMDRLVEWLPAHIPSGDETTIVHGDFRIDNVIFHPVEPRIIAVLDWELSTLGHPLADFAFHAMMYHMPPNIVAGLEGLEPAALNIPTEAQYVDAYRRRTSRSEIPDYGFYLAFSFFRLAAIFHGIKGRTIRGTAVSPHAHERASHFPRLAEIAWERAQAA